MSSNAAVIKNSDTHLLGLSIVGKIFGIVIAVWLISISYYAFLFFILGMLPAFATTIIDRGVGRYASKTVSACNFAGLAPYLFEISLNSNPSLGAKVIISDLDSWVFIYGAAVTGWMLIWILPQLTLLFYELKINLQIKKYHRKQEDLIKEWGEKLRVN